MARRFELYRYRDPSGVSGTGVVAQGCCWLTGKVSLQWLGATPSISTWDSLREVLAVHGHGGSTVVRWIDPPIETSETGNRYDLGRAAASPSLPTGGGQGAYPE